MDAYYWQTLPHCEAINEFGFGYQGRIPDHPESVFVLGVVRRQIPIVR